ncbi:MAG: carboxypeptidase regulatory-like domain-containing protein [Chitinophagaceae bacterium]|nr:MAG: carboxypeptidase regulatory-like domain-containing protein [Chitinophagaceae bacterium]
MKTLLLISFTSLFVVSFGQTPTKITGVVVDENRKPITNVTVQYGNTISDTAYTNKKGRFSVVYPSPQEDWYYFYFERKDFLPKSFFVDLSDKDITLSSPVTLRSRKGFWYDTKQIDSTHLGITVGEAIKKYKLDIEMCSLWDEPPGAYHHFTTELADSSEICFLFQGIFTKEKRLRMNDILDRRITGIGISYTDGTEKIVGKGFTHQNPYFVERKIKAAQK